MIQGIAVERSVRGSVAADTITLEESDRHRRRIAMTSDNGIAFLLNLPEARLLRDGEAIRLEDGRRIAVRAKPEALYAVRGSDAAHLLTLAWQIGNRHLPVQVFPDRLHIRRDPVIRAMLEELGAVVEETDAGFHPQPGAYAGHAHAHSHGGRPIADV